MPDIKIHRDHSLGLTKARRIAWAWAEQVEQKFDLQCTVIEGEGSDTVEFKRSGVDGRLIVAADHFDLEAKLGFLLGAFSKTIEGEIMKNLDALLAQGAGVQKTATKSAAKAPAKEAAKAPAKDAAKAPARAAAKAAGSKKSARKA